tara:strand:- start:468 stop:3254 length:2787 start_codon:yes stop_codon:yes gene_type:complete
MKLKLLSVICLIPMLGLTQAPISYFEFNDTAGASFNTFVNSGSDSTTWNNGASGAVITDGANLVVQGGTVDLAGPSNGANTGQNGQIFRKILYPTTYDSGQYRLEIDFASWDLDVNQADSGKIEIGVYEASGFATKAAAIALKQQADGYRIQFFGELAAGDIYRNYDVTNNNSTVGSGIFALDIDLDANTITPYTNGVAMTSAITVDDKVIGNFQFTCQNLSSNSTAAINRMGLIDLNGTAGGGGDGSGSGNGDGTGGGNGGGSGGGSSDSAQGLNDNTDASSHWDFDDDYGATALEKFTYNDSGKQFAAVGLSYGPSNEGSLASGFNYGGGGDNRTDDNGNVTFYGKGGTRSDGNAPTTLFRTMPSDAGYTEGTMPSTGVLSFVVDFDSWNLDTNSLATGSILDIAAFNGAPGNGDVLTGITVNAHTNGQGRIQVRSSIAGGTSPQQYRTLYYPLSTTNLPKVTVELDLDNDTVVYLTNDVVWQQAPNLTNINASAELTHIRFGMGNVGSTNSTIKVDGFAVYQRIDASEVTKIPVNIDGSEFSGSSVYMGGTNFVLNFASTNIASTAFATNGFANSGQDFFLGAYHSTVIDPAVLADLALNSAVTNDGGGRGAVVLSSHGTESYQHGGFRIQEQSLQNQISYNQLAPTPGSTSDGVVIYKQDEFLDGLSSGNVAFEAGADTLSVELDFAGKERMSEARFSWVIEDNGTFYRSQPITMTHGANEANVANANTLTNLSANALAVNWYTYDETAVDVNNIGGAATPTLQKIGGIGFIYGVTWTGATETGGNWARYQVQSFSAEGATAAVVSEISTWLTQNGLTVTTGDADGDGRVDLLEYALGTNPGVSDTAGISGEVSDGNILFTHAKRAGIDHGVTYTVQTNANLKFPVWADSTTVPATETSSTVTHTIETATEDELFIRLKVELDD